MLALDNLDLDKAFLKPAELAKATGATSKNVANYADRRFLAAAGANRGRGRARLFSLRAAFALCLSAKLDALLPGLLLSTKSMVCDGVFGLGRFEWKQAAHVLFGLHEGALSISRDAYPLNSGIILSVAWRPIVDEVIARLKDLGKELPYSAAQGPGGPHA